MTEAVGKVFDGLAVPVAAVVVGVVAFVAYRGLQDTSRAVVNTAVAEPVPLPVMTPVVTKFDANLKLAPTFTPIGAPPPGHQGVPAKLFIPTAPKK